LAHVCDFRANSDLPRWLSQEEAAAMQHFLQAKPKVQQIGRYQFQLDDRLVDFSAIATSRPW
jgi:hypothetical protein